MSTRIKQLSTRIKQLTVTNVVLALKSPPHPKLVPRHSAQEALRKARAGFTKVVKPTDC